MRRLHIAFISLILLLAAGTAGLFYLNRFVLPVKARLWMQTAASQALGRPVTIGRVQIHGWHGFILEKVTIAEDPSFGTQPVLEADQISGGVLFLPILKNRELIIPALHVVRPRLRFLQNSAGIWNVQGLKPKPAAKPGSPSRFRLLVPRWVLSDGRVEISTQKSQPPRSFQLQKIQIDAHFRLPAQVEGSASLELQSVPPVPISLEGSYDLTQRRFHVKSKSDWPLPVVLSYLPEAQQKQVGSLEGTAGVELEANGAPSGPMELGLWLETTGLRWKKDLEAEGEIRAHLEGKFPSLRVEEIQRHLQGTLTLDRIHLRPVPIVEELQELSGDLQVDSKGIRTERLTARVPGDVPVELAGSIAQDAARTVGFRLSSQFRLEQPPPLPPAARDFLKNSQLAGQAKLEVVGSGTLRPERSIQPSATITLEGITAEFPKGVRWSNGQAVLRWQPDLLTFNPLRVQVLDRTLELEGTLVDFAQPEIDTQVRWGDLSAEAHLNLNSEKVEIEDFSGRYGPAAFRILGEISQPEPVANLFGEASFSVEKLEALAPKPLAWISRNGLAGECTARLQLQGDLSKSAGLDGQLNLSSPKLLVWKIPLEGFSAELARNGGVTEIRSVQASVAGGSARVSGSVRDQEPKKPWQARVTVEELDLARLGQILEWKNQTLSGRTAVEWTGSGEGAEPASVNGEGSLRIHGAQIAEFPLLGPFAELVGAPMLRAIAFQEAQGSFRLAEGKIQADNFQLASPQATITIAGWGGFLKGADSPIDWRIIPVFAPELIPEETRSRIGKVLAKGTRYLMGEVQVIGTWKEPKKKFVPKPVTKILNEQLFNLQEILKDLF